MVAPKYLRLSGDTSPCTVVRQSQFVSACMYRGPTVSDGTELHFIVPCIVPHIAGRSQPIKSELQAPS